MGYLTAESGAVAPGRPQRTLVLIHGFPLTASMWDAQTTALRPGWRLIAPDLRGFGESVMAGTGAGTIDGYVGDVIDLLDALHVHEAVFGGLSMGGYVVFGLLRHAHQYVAGLILANTRAQADSEEARAARRRMLTLIEQKGAAGVAEELLPKLLGASTRQDRPEIVTYVRELMLGHSSDALKAAVMAMLERPDSTDLLKTIRCPTLIVTGPEDMVIPMAASEEMQRAIPGALLDVLPKAGHFSNLEQPEAFNASLRHFLERL